MNRMHSVMIVLLALGWLGFSERAQGAASSALQAAVEQSRATGIVTVPAHEEFFRKTRDGQVETLANIWKLFEARGVRLTRMEIVHSGTTKIVMTYSPGTGLVAVR